MADHLPLTQIPGVPDPRTMIGGMTHFAGTGPKDTICGDCVFYSGDRIEPGRCTKYMRMVRKGGRSPRIIVPPRTPSCKYYEERDNRP